MKLMTLCYIRKDGKTLMLHRTKKENDVHEGKWNGVGGKFENGENAEECAVREVLEETGLKAKRIKLKGILTFPEFANSEDFHVFIFLIDDFEGQLKECDEGELEWISNSSILDLNLWEGDRIFIPLLSQERLFTGKFIYKNKRLISHSLNFY